MNHLQKLNLFPSTPPSNSSDDLRLQRISTHLFLLLLALSFFILLIYISTLSINKSITVPTPDVDTYLELYATYSRTLRCPCSNINVNYKTFLQVDYTLHEVCSSRFVTGQWIEYIYPRNLSRIPAHDLRMWGKNAFFALRSLCELAQTTISNALSQFHINNYVNDLVVPKSVLEIESHAFIDDFISFTAANFLTSLRFVREMLYTYRIQSLWLTNFYLEYLPENNALALHVSSYNRSCLCSYTYSCVADMYIVTNQSPEVRWPIPGLYVGCYVLEALRQSRLTCFYNETCLNTLLMYLQSRVSISVTALDVSKSIRFNPDTSIAEMLDHLMVEAWKRSVTYENYYIACQPTECVYTIVTKHDLLYVVTTIIGLIGGLVTTLKLVVPRLVSFIASRFNRRSILVQYRGIRSRSDRLTSLNLRK